jgi:hypothetical protein
LASHNIDPVVLDVLSHGAWNEKFAGDLVALLERKPVKGDAYFDLNLLTNVISNKCALLVKFLLQRGLSPNLDPLEMN